MKTKYHDSIEAMGIVDTCAQYVNELASYLETFHLAVLQTRGSDYPLRVFNSIVDFIHSETQRWMISCSGWVLARTLKVGSLSEDIAKEADDKLTKAIFNIQRCNSSGVLEHPDLATADQIDLVMTECKQFCKNCRYTPLTRLVDELDAWLSYGRNILNSWQFAELRNMDPYAVLLSMLQAAAVSLVAMVAMWCANENPVVVSQQMASQENKVSIVPKMCQETPVSSSLIPSPSTAARHTAQATHVFC